MMGAEMLARCSLRPGEGCLAHAGSGLVPLGRIIRDASSPYRALDANIAPLSRWPVLCCGL